MAAQNGRKKCVSLLLEKGSNILQKDLEGRNCLVITIQKHHQYVLKITAYINILTIYPIVIAFLVIY